MTEYCRLCAELRDPMEIVTTINDVEQLMEQKLCACSQWTTENTEHRLPYIVCSSCLDKLDKCWLFSRSVQLSQQRLLDLFVDETEIETKPLVTVVIPPTYDDSLAYSNQNSAISLETTQEFHYTEYHPDDGDTNMLEEFYDVNDLNENVYSDYFEESKNGIVPIQTEDNTNNVPKSVQIEPYHKHKCIDSGQQFSTKSSLKRHSTIHSGVKLYECWLCHKMFRLNFYLSKHILTHSYTQNEISSNRSRKRVSGIISRKSRKYNTSRKERDSEDFRFSCDDCGRKFVRKSQLTKHRVLHSAERPYKCECGRRYKHKSNLLSHQEQLNHLVDDANEIKCKNESFDVENSLDYKLSALFSMILSGGESQDEKVKRKRSISKVANNLNQSMSTISVYGLW